MQKVTDVELENLPENIAKGDVVEVSLTSILSDVTVSLEVVVGEFTTSIEHLVKLKRGEVLELDQSVDSKLKVLYRGQLIAEGNMVAVGDNYGVEVTDVYLDVAD
mgnify:CR=1 FL=1